MYIALQHVMPNLVGSVTLNYHVFDGKHSLLRSLEARLRGYASMFKTWHGVGVVVLVDEDREDCNELKKAMEAAARRAGLGTLSSPLRGKVKVLNRIVVEELEAWFFGDPKAVIAAYPRVRIRSFARASITNPDAISGGTWEALERVLQRHNYHQGGLAKTTCASDVAVHMDVAVNASPSFRAFSDGLERLLGKDN